jgi:SAM-dependent methyltransferase
MPTAPYGEPGHIFTSCAAAYIQFRPQHPPRLVQYLADEVSTCSAPRAVLDVGCGPGILALDLAEHGLKVTAVDPSAEMLAAGWEWARKRNLGGVQWIEADVPQLADRAGDIRAVAAVTTGDALHWMDRPAALDALDRIVQPDAFVALLGSRASGSPGLGGTRCWFSSGSGTWAVPAGRGRTSIMLNHSAGTRTFCAGPRSARSRSYALTTPCR